MMDGDDEKTGETEDEEAAQAGISGPPGKTAPPTQTALDALGVATKVKDLNNLTNKALQNISVSSIDTARIKTAFSCASKLALAGVINSEEVDSYAEQMLNDNLKADSMIRQTKLLLKSAQTATERVAAAAAERMGSVRTASNLGVSTSPAFSGGQTTNNSAALDIQGALKGTWTMPTIED
jgi:hypothetical protein